MQKRILGFLLLACAFGCTKSDKPTTTARVVESKTLATGSSNSKTQPSNTAKQEIAQAKREYEEGVQKALKESADRKAKIDKEKEELRITEEKLALIDESKVAYGGLSVDERKALLRALERLKVVPCDALTGEEKEILLSVPASAKKLRESATKQAMESPEFKHLAKVINLTDDKLKQNTAQVYGLMDLVERQALLHASERLKSKGYNELTPEEKDLLLKVPATAFLSLPK